MNNFLNNIRLYFVDHFTATTSELLAEMHKLEAKIEAAIDKDLRYGETLVEAAKNLNDALLANDRNLNAAYKLLNIVNKATQ